MAISITLSVLPDTQEEAIRAVEALSRAGTGLAFEGLTATLSFTTYEPEEDS